MAHLIEDLCRMAWKGDRLDEFKAMINQFDGAEINTMNARGQTALYCASYNGHKNHVLALLLAPGIDLNCQTTLHGSTPLHAAAFQDQPVIVALLLAAGADPKIQNYSRSCTIPGLTPRDEALFAANGVFTLWDAEGPQALTKIEPDCALLLARAPSNNVDLAALTNFTSLEELVEESIVYPRAQPQTQDLAPGHSKSSDGRSTKSSAKFDLQYPKVKLLENNNKWIDVILILYLEANVYRLLWFVPKKKQTYW